LVKRSHTTASHKGGGGVSGAWFFAPLITLVNNYFISVNAFSNVFFNRILLAFDTKQRVMYFSV
jgi:hypothetical protein